MNATGKQLQTHAERTGLSWRLRAWLLALGIGLALSGGGRLGNPVDDGAIAIDPGREMSAAQ